MKNLTAYDEQDKALFYRSVKNKAQGRKEILNNPLLVLVNYVNFNNRRFPISDIYKKWPIL